MTIREFVIGWEWEWTVSFIQSRACFGFKRSGRCWCLRVQAMGLQTARTIDTTNGGDGEQRGFVADTLWSCIAATNDDEKSKVLWTRIWQGTAIGSFAFNLIAIIVEGSAVVICAGLVALGISPVVALRQEKLQHMDSTFAVVACLASYISQMSLQPFERSRINSEIR